jgi:hypothetical protein
MMSMMTTTTTMMMMMTMDMKQMKWTIEWKCEYE